MPLMRNTLDFVVDAAATAAATELLPHLVCASVVGPHASSDDKYLVATAVVGGINKFLASHCALSSAAAADCRRSETGARASLAASQSPPACGDVRSVSLVVDCILKLRMLDVDT
jgi:hypothetical protein